jgi:selenocysteine lyase/cysteine desulfurase
MEPVAKRTRELAGKLKEGLASVADLTLHTPQDEAVSAGLVTFELDGQRPDQVVDSLRSKGIVASVTPYAAEYVRLGTTVLVDEDDVDVATREVAALA